MLQLCTFLNCSHHLNGDRLNPAEVGEYNVEETARNPFRVLNAPSDHVLGCFSVGSTIREDEHINLTRARIGNC